MSEQKEERNKGQAQRETPKRFSKDWWKLVGLVIKQSVKDFIGDNGPQWAAAISYYTLLSAFPLMLAIVSVGAFFVPEETMTAMLTEVLGDFLPEGEEQVETIVSGAMDARVGVSAFSILLLIWGGSRVFGVLTRALNIFYDVDEPYGFLKRTAIEMLMLLSIGLLFVAALASRFILGILLSEVEILNSGTIVQVLTQAIPFVLLLISFFLIYRFVPRRRVHWKAALTGAIFASVTFVIARPLFWYYIEEFAEYELVYGPIAIVIILVFWTWLVALFVLYGGELVGHIQDMIIEGTPAEEVEKRHLLRSPFHSDRKKAEEGEDGDESEEFKALERSIGKRGPSEQEDQHPVPGEHLPELKELAARSKNPQAEKGVLAFSGLSLMAALSSAVLLFMNLRRKI
jgi:membrane protein